ncbi:nuclear transport factor 2 family protein [Rhodococcus opacus]|uniref:nuclear transport factor 2 family protein n=1 Tax=Rhodococcus opacus TaxID=37919 RepID=UPI000EAA6943|nr:nuclear transport factor 2 family protein [Rhodococcus opacus]QZS52518.1 nuclear transport factor 2 family protein [Rhodococcus opacus]RKM64932.1 hypothetical protein COO55_38675 [Rhodococcus opacus]
MNVDASTRAAIEELNARFAWSLDLNRFDDLYEILTEDASYTSGNTERRGAESIVAAFSARSGIRTTRHGWTSLTLTEVDDATISGRSAWFCYAHNSHPPVTSTAPYMVADFLDTYTRTEGGWRIAARTIVPVFRDASLAPA